MNDETLLFIFQKVKLPKVLEIRFINFSSSSFFVCAYEQEWASIFKRIQYHSHGFVQKGGYLSVIHSFIHNHNKNIIGENISKNWMIGLLMRSTIIPSSAIHLFMHAARLQFMLCCAMLCVCVSGCIRVEWRKAVGDTTLSRDKSIKQYKNMVSVHALHTHRRGRVHLLSSCHSCSTIYLTSQKDK